MLTTAAAIRQALVDALASGQSAKTPVSPFSRAILWLPWIVLAAFCIFWVARWPAFPLMLDPYYHLQVAREVAQAGGVIAHQWWEAAPKGRLHLYPPLLHLVLAGLLRSAVPPITAIRLVTLLVPSVLLGTIFLSSRRLFGRSVGLATLLTALVPFSWLVHMSDALASGLGSIFLLWLLVALYERRWIAVACLFVLIGYTHLGLPWVALATIGCCCAVRALPLERSSAKAIALGVFTASPWMVRVALALPTLRVVARAENSNIEIVPALLVLAAIGAWRCLVERCGSKVLIALWFGSCVLIYPYMFRWVSGEGVLPVILLAGYGTEFLIRCVQARGLNQRIICGSALLLAAVVMLSPTVSIGSKRAIIWWDSTPFHLINWPLTVAKTLEQPLYSERIKELAQMTASLTAPREILWSNAPYAGGLVAALAGRSTSSAMFYEVAGSSTQDPVADAHLVVWFKIQPLADTPLLSDLISRYRLVLVADQSLAMILRNPGATQLAREPQAVVPWWPAFVLSCVVLGLAAYDLWREPTRVA